jgi:DNA topoisomerase-2
MNVQDFIGKDYKEYATYDCVRSIPSITDGLKLPQRKALFGILDLNSKAKVSTATSHIVKVSGYLHGETSMEDTVVRMAQNYPGANNIALFEGQGQFGSRLSNESAASRYIYVSASDAIWGLMSKEDNLILDYKFEEGMQIEPHTYFPYVPFCLINGTSGIGTGFATDIMPHSYSDLKKAVKEVLKSGKVKTKLVPGYVGFKGDIEMLDSGQVLTKGKFNRVNTTTIEITELPIGYQNDKYKEVLNKLIEQKAIKDYDNLSTESEWKFIVYTYRNITALSDDELMAMFKLVSRNTQNLVMWDTNNRLKRYDSVEDILVEFVGWRVDRFEDLRKALIAKCDDALDEMVEKMKFIQEWVDSPMSYINKPKSIIIQAMINKGIKSEYLDKFIKLPISSLTDEDISSLRDKIKETELYKIELETKTAKDMYLRSL